MSESELYVRQMVEELSNSAVETLIRHLRKRFPDETPDVLAFRVEALIRELGLSPLVWQQPFSPFYVSPRDRQKGGSGTQAA